MQFDPNLVYFVESPTDDTVLLALDVRAEPNELAFFDTIRPRIFEGAPVAAPDGAYGFQTEDGDAYTLTVLTLATYNTRVKSELEDPPTFEDDAALHAFYVQNFLT